MALPILHPYYFVVKIGLFNYLIKGFKAARSFSEI